MVNKNKILQISLVCVASVIFIFAVTFAILTPTVGKASENSVTSSISENQTGYILTEYNGKLAVFHEGNSDPIEIFDITLDSLPQQDQELLTKGLKTSSKKELLLWIEDYSS